MRSLAVFAFFTDVEAFYRAVIAHYPGVDQAFASFVRVFGKDIFNFKRFHVRLVLGYLGSDRHISGNIRVRRPDNHGQGRR